MTQNIFDSQQKRRLVDKFMQHVDKFKVRVSSSGANKITVSSKDGTFNIKTQANYTRLEKQILNRG